MTDKTIIAGGGGDYTSITAWEAASDVSSSTWRGIISDNSSYGEFTIGEPTGTPDSTNRIILTVASANRHSGVWGTGHARILRTTSGGRAIEVQADWTVLEYLQVTLDTNGTSDECIRFTGDADDVFTISRCVLRCIQTIEQQDCIYTMTAVSGQTINIDNCVMTNAGRGNIHAYVNGARSITLNVDNCSLLDGGNFGDSGVGTSGGNIFAYAQHASGTITFNVYNTWGQLGSGAHGNADCYNNAGPGTETWTGANNIATDASAESKFTTSFDSVAVVEVEPSSGENVWVNDKDSTWDLDIAGENAFTVTQNGSDRTGSEPDSTWQDFSTDIAGVTRSAFTIGAFEFETAVVGLIPRNAVNLQAIKRVGNF